MRNRKRRVTSFLAGLLALLTILPTRQAEAERGDAAHNDDSVVHWGTTLPKDGDMDYNTDSGWHRLVLEYGDYCTNAVDSEGNYVNLTAETTTSWPEKAWHDSYDASFYQSQPTDWPGLNKTEWMKAGTLQREEDSALYRNGEYSQDGMYSLWIKYAGTCSGGSNKGEDCWYISPCDANGDRAKKLWALDCCVDATSEDPKYYDLDDKMIVDNTWRAYGHGNSGIKPISNGITPVFTLLTPDFKTFEESDNFKYAGVAIAYYYTYWEGNASWPAELDARQDVNTGKIRCDYNDNEKWIIKSEKDTATGETSVTIRSAGWIDWDWSDPDGDFVKLLNDPAQEMADGIAAYIKGVSFAQVQGTKERSYKKEANYTRLCFYLGPWCLHDWSATEATDGAYYTPFYHFAYMIFLSEYAENVYICGGYKHTGTSGFEMGAGVVTSEALPNGELSASYGMKFINNVTAAQYDAWYDYDINHTMSEYDAISIQTYYKNWSSCFPSEIVGIKVKDSQLNDLGETTTTYYTVDEIKATLPISVESNWKPSKNEGAFSAIYVGDVLETADFQENGGSVTVGDGSTLVLGITDKGNDGVCDGAAYIGTFMREIVQSRMVLSYTSTQITVEKGASMQIDGPTYAAVGTTITVQGSLQINPGAVLSPETIRDNFPAASREGIHLIIDGGTVTINSGSMLDVGFADVEIKNGGTLINNGVFIQANERGTDSIHSLTMQGGTIENGGAAWFITGADVKNGMRQTMLRTANESTTLAQLASCLSNIKDSFLANYAAAQTQELVHEAASFRMEDSSTMNLFRNQGNALLVHSVSGDGEDMNKVRNGGKIYRGLDIVGDSAIVVSDSDFSTHEALCRQNGTTVSTDSTIQSFYEISGIDYDDTIYVRDSEGETEAQQQNVMALRVGTGSQGTTGIANFQITYVDNLGTTRTQIIDTASLSQTYEFVSDWNYCGTTQNQKGDSLLKTHKTGGVLSANSKTDGLESLSNVVYIFQTSNPLSYVESIAFSGTGVGSWTCTELNVYRVSYLYPLQEYGWCSEDWYVPFEGELIAETALNAESGGNNGRVFNWDSETVEIGTGFYQLKIYNAPDSARTKTDATGFSYYKTSKEYKTYSTNQQNYTFSITLADAEGAGMESLYSVGTDLTFNKLLSDSNWLKLVKTDVTLDMVISYIDTQGSVRQATLPLILSSVEWAYANMNEASRKEAIHGLFQQGEEIAFRAPLPDFASLLGATITYNDSAEAASIAVAAASVASPDYTNALVKDGILTISAPESALYYYCASDLKGTIIDSGRTMNLNMKEWNGTEQLKPATQGNRYLIIVETDSMATAGTTRDLYVSFNYESVTGATFTTGTYSLRTAVNNYYGYWLTSTGEDAGCAYLAAVSPGGQMYFVLDLANVYKFTSATFSMPANGASAEVTDAVTELSDDTDVAEAAGNAEAAAETDEENIPTVESWQMKSITVYELDEVGERKVVLGSGTTLSGGLSTNRTYYRDNVFSTRGSISRVKSAVLVAPGQTKTVNFDGTTGENEYIGGTKKNEATNATELRYEDTKKDFGFNTRRVKYSVSVFVDGTSVTSVEDGDCGSQNQFYFQLVFQDDDGNLHTSPCVLANQQLQSDGFRTGTEEKFSIYTNDDYGTPVQINIIPDDTSSTSDVFDKLCIKKVVVSRTSGTGVNLSWIADEVGWIDIQYKEDAEDQDGRTNEELLRSFQLKDNGYSVWLEFAVETDAVYYNSRQFVGQVLADITYRDTSGALQTTSDIPVVSEIADYAERKSELAAATEKGTEVSMPSFMFRNGYTNRFLLDFTDISSLVSIRFRISSTEAGSGWTINNVSARQVYDQGTLNINVFNEYEHVYTIDPQDLASTSNTKALSIAATGSKNSGTLYFTSGNSIVINVTEEEEEVEVQKGESEGANDVISMTVELDDTEGIAAGAAMTARVVYKNIYGDCYEVPASLVFDADSQKFMIPENDLPKTADIGVPYQVEITGGTLAGRKLTAVKVYQLRDHNVEETFLFVPEEALRLQEASPVTLVLSESEQDAYAKRRGYTNESQKAYLQLGSLTNRVLLTETQDLQLALVYTEQDDPYSYEHTSDYVSVIDCGYTVLKSGDVLCIPMSVNNIGSVKSIMLKTTSANMKINVEKACIYLEETSNMSGSMLSYGWVNLPVKTALIETEGTAMNTDGTGFEQALTSATRITPISVETELTTIARSDAILKVSVYYVNAAGNTSSVIFEKSASEWNKDTAWALIDGISGVSLYKIEVYDTDSANTASVTVGKLNIGWFSSAGEYTTASVTGDTVITEGTFVTNALMNTSITGTVVSGGNSLNLQDNAVAAARTEYQTIAVDAGTAVQISAGLAGVPGGLELTCVDKVTGETIFTTSTTQAAISYSYAFPVNLTEANIVYEVTVASQTFPEAFSARFTIELKPSPYLEVVYYELTGENAGKPVYMQLTNSQTIEYNTSGWKEGQNIVFFIRAGNCECGVTGGGKPVLRGVFTTTVNEDISIENYGSGWTMYTLTRGSVQGSGNAKSEYCGQFIGELSNRKVNFTAILRGTRAS